MYLFLPVAGWPEVVDQHPDPAIISDKLGGAMLSRTAMGNGQMLLIMRDDAADFPINPTASVLASFGASAMVPIKGPVAVIELSGGPDADDIIQGRMECMPGEKAHALHDLAEDIAYAMLGRDEQISDRPNGTKREWASQVRKMVAHISAIPIPDGYPDAQEIARRAHLVELGLANDPVADLFARAGIMVKPGPYDPFAS